MISKSNEEKIITKIQQHPCFNVKAHRNFARIHLPVAPACNVQCNYCNRKYDCVNESRPGVSSNVLSPEAALERVIMVKGKIPNLSVVGIAGPGDPLANPEQTFKTFSLIKARFPEMELCLSTNGLMLPNYIEEVHASGIEFVTITLNAVDPEIGEKIYNWVRIDGKIYTGREAATILLVRQLEALRLLREKNIICKVNTVVIPGVNDAHIPAVVEKANSLGAFISNIIPLIPVEGTKFADKPQLDITKLQQIRDLCPPDMKQMKHCKQCRADAVGLLGEDRSQEFFTPCHKNECQKADHKVRVAVTSSNGRAVDLHFGHAQVFHIYETDGELFDLVDVRNIEQYCKEPVECGDDEQRLTSVMEALKDCKYILVSRIGLHPAKKLGEKGIEALMVVGTVAELVPKAARGEVTAIKWDQEISGIA